jgi:hypothetical protein
LQVDFDRRFVNNIGNDCLMSVGGTDFWIPQKRQGKKGNPFGSHKYASKSAQHYELGVNIREGNLVWIQGPYPAGKWPDIKIFNAVFANFLEQYEPMMATVGTPTRLSAYSTTLPPPRSWRCRHGCGRGTR